MRALVRLVVAAAIAAPLAAGAEPAPASGTQVYQQRLPDGSVVLTDQPVDGAKTQRTWQVMHEDPIAARAREEQMHLEAQTVTERVQRRLDEERLLAEQRDLERLRLQLAEARRDAEIARANADVPAVLIVPQPPPHLHHRGRPELQRHPHPPRGPVMRAPPPRPGWKRPHPGELPSL